MDYVFKCQECETGPCYVSGRNAVSDGSVYDNSSSPYPPCRCPFCSDENANFELVDPNVSSVRFGEYLQDWLAGEGYDSAPEELRDAILGDGFEQHISRNGSYDLLRIIGMLRGVSCYSFERDDFVDELKKQKKEDLIRDLLATLYPEGFKSGICYALKWIHENQKHEGKNA